MMVLIVSFTHIIKVDVTYIYVRHQQNYIKFTSSLNTQKC